MFHKRLFKVLGNLSLLVVLFTGQVAAAPIHSLDVVNEDSSVSEPLQLNSDVAAQPNELLQQSEEDLLSAGETIRISGEAGGDNPSISMDGQYIAYQSAGDIVLYDMALGTNTAIDSGTSPVISANGRYVAYVQESVVFVWDRAEGTKTPAGIGVSPSI
jgi:hypothetical protein